VKPALVILAAGASTRLGTCKALVALGGATPLALLLRAGAGLDELPALVVAGADAARIGAALPGAAELLVNPRWASGRTSGIALAAAARAGRDLCLAPVDVPLVPRAVFAALAREWERRGAPARGWLAPACGAGPERRHGHPLILGRELAAEAAGLAPGAPLRELRARAAPLWGLEVEDPSVLDDLDTPADLERLRARGSG